MKAITLVLKGTLWAVYRAFGLGAFALAMAYAYIILKLELAFVPRSELIPYFATILGMFCGTLFLLPSTTPHWVRVVDDATSATIAIAAVIGLAVALVSGSTDVVPALGLDETPLVPNLISGGIGALTALGILSAGGLGLLSPKRTRRIPLMDLKAPRNIDPRSLRKSRI